MIRKLTQLHNNIIRSNLSSLKLHVCNLTENHFEYIIQHLPNLKDFNLRTDKPFEEILSTASPSIIYKFALYLTKIDRFQIQGNEPSSSRRANYINDPSNRFLILWDLYGTFPAKTVTVIWKHV